MHRDSIDFDIAWFQSRYDKKGPGGGDADYINLPMNEEQYRGFVAALLAGEKTDFKEWEKSTPYFEACLPIEVMAARGRGDAALRADEAGGIARSAQPARGPMRWCSCARTMRWAPCGTWWASRPSSNMASRCASSAPFRAWTMPSSRGWAGFTATPSSIRPGCWTANCG